MSQRGPQWRGACTTSRSARTTSATVTIPVVASHQVASGPAPGPATQRRLAREGRRARPASAPPRRGRPSVRRGVAGCEKRSRGGCVTGRPVVGPVVVCPAARTGTGPPNRAVMLPLARVVRAGLTGQPDTDVLERATSALQARRGVQDEAGTRPGAVVHDALHQMITLVSGLDR